MFQQYQLIELTKDLNPAIRKGMIGVILDILDDNVFEVEFVKADGTNYEFEGQFTFTVTTDAIRAKS